MKVLVSNIMMLRERERFEKILTEKGFDCDFPDVKQNLGEEELLAMMGEYDAWLAGDDEITQKVLEKSCPKLKVISKWGTGIDSIDKEACKNFGVKLYNSPGAFKDAVSEVAMAYILDLARKISYTDRRVRKGLWPKPQCESLQGKTLGIIGFGAIGRGLAEKANAFNMNILACDPYFEEGSSLLAQKASFEETLKNSDYLCLACNLSKENYHLLNEEAFNLMKKGMSLINVARGPLVDEKALLKSLKNGKVSGAALDVYETEPPFGSELLTLDQVILGSHNANNTQEAIEAVHENTLRGLYEGLN